MEPQPETNDIMPVRLKLNGFMSHHQLVVMDEHVVVLNPAFNTDRVHRLGYERLSTVQVWRTFPWMRAIVTTVIVGGGASPWLIWGEDELRMVGVGLLIILAVLMIFIVLNRKIHIRFVRGDTDLKVSGFAFRTRRLDRFIEALEIAWHRGHARAYDAAQEREAERRTRDQAPPPPSPDTEDPFTDIEPLEPDTESSADRPIS